MTARPLRDRYKSPLLQPGQCRGDAGLIGLLMENGIEGAVFHVLQHVPEQAEDLYTLLVDDRLVVAFEIRRGGAPMIAEALHVLPLAQFRSEIGQGKERIRLDQAVADAHKLLGN